MINTRRIQWCVMLLSLNLILGCSERSESVPAADDRASVAQATPTPKQAPAPKKELSHAELVAQGEKVYKSNCTACHNMDPSKKGSLGPAIAGSSEALVEARVVHGNYPPGYTPKADSRLMVAMPYLSKDVKALSAYLQN